MKIEGEYINCVKISELDIGATFVYKGQLYVKIVVHPIVMCSMIPLSNAVINLKTNVLDSFNADTEVLPVSVKIVIE